MLMELLSLVMTLPGPEAIGHAVGAETQAIARASADLDQQAGGLGALLTLAERQAMVDIVVNRLVMPVLQQPSQDAALRSLHQRERHMDELKRLIIFAFQRLAADDTAMINRQLLKTSTAEAVAQVRIVLGKDAARSVQGAFTDAKLVGLRLLDRIASNEFDPEYAVFQDLYRKTVTFEAALLVVVVGAKLAATPDQVSNIRACLPALVLSAAEYYRAASALVDETEQERERRHVRNAAALSAVRRAWSGYSAVDEYLKTKGDTDDA
jgi:hypothetical protein